MLARILVLLVAVMFPRHCLAQVVGPNPCANLVRAWVDPVFGVDNMGFGAIGSPQFFTQVDDSTAPFKTLQHAIDAVQSHLVTAFNTGVTNVEGLVYAMPGLYSPSSNGEIFPVKMRDRVHLRGQGARGCVLRGDGSNPTGQQFFWPDISNPGRLFGEVLVSFSSSDELSTSLGFPLPWAGTGETSEMLDSFTLQGGDVQVLFYKDFSQTFSLGAPTLRGRITNCLFDMRHDWEVVTNEGTIVVHGPFFGIEMAKLYSKPGGYADQQVLIANNTFLMCEFGVVGETLGNVTFSRMEAVGIVDVTDTGCSSSAILTDRDMTLRGLGNPILANNLLRTLPVDPSITPKPFAMLGIDTGDANVSGGSGAPMQSNAFSPSRVGGPGNGFSNGKFISKQVTPVFVGMGTNPPAFLYDCRNPSQPCAFTGGNPNGCCNPLAQPPACTGLQPPMTVLAVLDFGPTGLDPLFVGEYLESQVVPGPTRYRDHRLLPDSPFIDIGVKPIALAASPTWGSLPVLSTAPPGWTFGDPACSELRSFDWDHEGYGNPRVSGTTIDIGFDEFELFIMAGSYANDSNSHNTAGFMNPTPESGRPTRFMLFPVLSVGAPEVTINGVFAVQAPPPAATPPAWTQPPRTTSAVNPALPLGFQTRWISFTNASTATAPPMGTPMPWTTGATGPTAVSSPVGWNPTQSWTFSQFVISDLEVSTGYFGAQAVIHAAGQAITNPSLWSNLQYEYR